MDEQKVILDDEFTDLDKIRMNKTQSFSLGNIKRVLKMAEEDGKSQSQILEDAITAFYIRRYPTKVKKVSR